MFRAKITIYEQKIQKIVLYATLQIHDEYITNFVLKFIKIHTTRVVLLMINAQLEHLDR